MKNLKNITTILVLVLILTGAAMAQGNAFNFQGRLNDGTNPANGAYDLQFSLFNSITGGTQIGATIQRPNTVFINGVFSVNLDFGAAAFNNPNAVFIEISVKPNGSPNAFTILGPRQQLTVVPYAVRASTAANADNAANAVNAQNATNATNAVNATNATNAANATNATNAINATNATNATTANNALSLGSVAANGWTRLNVQNEGDILLTGRLQISGNATQFADANGLVKATLEVNAEGLITRCYNGITNSSTGNCGFTVTSPLFGVKRINFGFPVSGRFVSITCKYGNGSFGPIRNNSGANYRFFNNTSIEVFTFLADNAEDTFSTDFMLILY